MKTLSASNVGNILDLDLVKKDSLRACGLCGTVYTINATDHNSKCPNCKSKIQNKIDDL